MAMTSTEYVLIIIAVMVAATIIPRCVPFLFLSNQAPSAQLEFLGKYLPVCMMPLLVVYSLKDISFKNLSLFVPELVATIIVIVVHWKWKNALLSIGIGTAICVLLKAQFG